MNTEKNYLQVNREAWNSRVETHLRSDFYDLDGFKRGRNSLTASELEFLGNVSAKSILHLQCHFGQETISMARMGAKVTGSDLSDKAIAAAQALSQEMGVPADFICSDVYTLAEKLNQKFDVVFTSFGTIGWLPDVSEWLNVVSHFLKPGGTFVFVDFHPVVWMFDDNFDKIAYSYFQREAIIEEEIGSYADRESAIMNRTITWNHSMDQVLGGLLEKGFLLEKFKEYDSSPYKCFQHTVEVSPGQFQIKHLKDKLPMVYALRAKWQGPPPEH